MNAPRLEAIRQVLCQPSGERTIFLQAEGEGSKHKLSVKRVVERHADIGGHTPNQAPRGILDSLVRDRDGLFEYLAGSHAKLPNQRVSIREMIIECLLGNAGTRNDPVHANPLDTMLTKQVETHTDEAFVCANPAAIQLVHLMAVRDGRARSRVCHSFPIIDGDMLGGRSPQVEPALGI